MIVNKDNNLTAVRWLDNKAVHLMSTYIGIEPVFQIKRWSKEANSRVTITAPAIIAVKNKDDAKTLMKLSTFFFVLRNTTSLWAASIFVTCFTRFIE